MGVCLGTAERSGFDRGDSCRARSRHQLDRYGRGLRARPFRGSCWPRAKNHFQKPYIFTKCGRIWNDRGEIGKSLRADSIRRELEASLRRLQIDVVDLYQVHWPEPDEQIEEG